jgi:5'-nucleotidase/UDP-sugar diphosphatase
MKKLKVLISLMMILGLFSVTQAQIDTLTILHVNDTHSHLLPYGPKDAAGNWTWGGMARLATLIGASRMTDPNVMLLHAGDAFVGDFMFQEYVGVAELEIMKALNYDAFELGNHEFDLYPSTLKYVLNQAGFPGNGFPVLCANLDISGDPELGYFVQPYIIKEYGDLRVGIFGLLTDMTNQISNPSPVVVLPPLNVAQDWVDTLRAGHNCDIVILLSHLGSSYDQMIASSVSGIDVIVGGHEHRVIEQPLQIGNTLVLQAGEFCRYLGKLQIIVGGKISIHPTDGELSLYRGKTKATIQSWSYQMESVDSSVPAEPTLDALIGNLAAGIEVDPRFGPVYSQVIAQAKSEIKKPLGEGLCKDNGLGNLVSDAFRNLTGTDIAFQPQGFISQTIYPGPVKGADIFQAVPYGFDQTSGLGLKLATFRTDGLSLIYGLEFAVYNLPYAEDFFLHGSNISYVYNGSNPPGSRVDYSTITVNGQPLNPSATYTVTVPDGVVPFLTQIPGFQVEDLSIMDYFVYNVVKDFMISQSPVAYYAEGRVIDLASFADPQVGVTELSKVVDLYRENGSIKRQGIADKLKRDLELVHRHLEAGNYRAASLGLRLFIAYVQLQNRKGHISDWSSQKLVFLVDKLDRSIGYPLAKISEDETGVSQPEDFQLLQNYPNPFNPQTDISYSLPENSHVKLTVYNLLGQTVKTLVDEYQSAGSKEVTWDGRNERGESVASGIYLYRLEAGKYTETKKMSLLK